MRGYPSLQFVRTLALAAVVCLAPAAALAVQDYSNIRVVRLSLAEGDVFIQQLGEEAPGAEAMRNTPLRNGDVLSVERGLAEVEFEDGAMLRLPDYSAVEFSELALADGRRITRVTLLRGTASIHAELSRSEIFHIRTQHLDVAASSRSDFRLDVMEDQTFVTVTRGAVRVETGEGNHRVTRGRSLNFGPATAYQVRSDGRPADDWDRWVAQRQDEVATAASASLRYVNGPLRYGMADLTSYGEWVRVSYGSGFAWRPYGVAHGWMPFVHGSWRYGPGLGWYWASADPWGWLPYHFGGWHYSNLYGWLWYPDNSWYWQPGGHIRWFHHRGRLCWAPYSPFDRPGMAPVNSPVGCAAERPAGPSQPRGIRGVIARLNPEDQPTPLDGPPAAPADVGRRESRGIRGVIDRPEQPRETGIVYDPETGTFVNRHGPGANGSPATGIAGAVAPRDPGEGELPTAAPTDRPRDPRGGIRGVLTGPDGTPIDSARPARPVETNRPQTPRGSGTEARPAPQPRNEPPAPRAEPRPAPQVQPRPAPAPRAEPRPAPQPRSEPPAPRTEPRPTPQVAPRPAPQPRSEQPAPRAEPPRERPQPQASGLTGASRPQSGATASRPSSGASASRPSSGGIRGATQASRPQPRSQPRSRPNPN